MIVVWQEGGLWTKGKACGKGQQAGRIAAHIDKFLTAQQNVSKNVFLTLQELSFPRSCCCCWHFVRICSVLEEIIKNDPQVFILLCSLQTCYDWWWRHQLSASPWLTDIQNTVNVHTVTSWQQDSTICGLQDAARYFLGCMQTHWCVFSKHKHLFKYRKFSDWKKNSVVVLVAPLCTA